MNDNQRVNFTTVVMVVTVLVGFAFLLTMHFLWLLILFSGIVAGCVLGHHFGYYYGRILMLDDELRKSKAKLAELKAHNQQQSQS